MRMIILLGGLGLAGCATQGPGTTDVERGRQVFVSRDQGHCVICHSVPGVAEAGNVGPPLAGIGSRLTASEIRYRVEDITRVSPNAVMPAFGRVEGLQRVAPSHAAKPIMSAAQLDDVAAYLASLR